MAKKKISRKRPGKKKMSPITKILIGAAAIGGGWLIYDQFFAKPKEDKAAADAQAAAQAAQEGATAAQVINSVTPGTGITKAPISSLLPGWLDPTKPQETRKLTPKGTPGSAQNWGLTLYKYDKGGEIETLQKLFNRISKAYGKTGIQVDGVFGNETEKKRIAILGGKPGITLAQVYKLTLYVEDQKNKSKMGTPLTMNPYDATSYLTYSGIPTITPNWVNVKP